MDDATLDRLAALLVGFGANVQPGQVVALESELGKEALTRRVAAAAYRRGARFVDVQYFDPWVKRVRIELAPDDSLDYVPSWYGDRVRELGRQRCARIRLEGPVAPGLLDDLDPARAGRDQLPRLAGTLEVVRERTTNWTIGPAPTDGWARAVYPELAPEQALAALWRDVVHMLRLDEPYPVAAWRRRQDALETVAERLTAARFSALHFEGPGTDLVVGLFASSRWLAARFETVDGIAHAPNLPSEEVFTTPDPTRVEGVARATKPLALGGTVVRGMRVRFEAGRAVAFDAERGAEAISAQAGKDAGAARLGEVALVDGEGRVGALDRVFLSTLIDENAASHIALGGAYTFAVEDEDERAGANTSEIHVDFMIGADDVEVTGIERGGGQVPVLRGGAWQL